MRLKKKWQNNEEAGVFTLFFFSTGEDITRQRLRKLKRSRHIYVKTI
jgi:hypothetical protein